VDLQSAGPGSHTGDHAQRPPWKPSLSRDTSSRTTFSHNASMHATSLTAGSMTETARALPHLYGMIHQVMSLRSPQSAGER
jgi:hypothetical protein